MKSSKRRARARRKSKQGAQPQAGTTVQPAFSPDEEAFFREGAALSAAASSDALETFADLDAGHVQRPSLWRRLFSRDDRGAAAPAGRYVTGL